MKKLLLLIALAALGFGGWAAIELFSSEEDPSFTQSGEISAPDGQLATTRVVPGGGETRVALDNGIAVIVADGIVAEDTPLSVHHRTPRTTPRNRGGLEPIAAVDVELGENHELSAPVKIEIPVPAELATAGPLEDALACRYYVPELADWGRVPCSFDADRKVAVVTTEHLSIFGLFKFASGFEYEKLVHNSVDFRLIWDGAIPFAERRLAVVREALEKACDKYVELGFIMPSYRLDVVLLDNPGGEESKYEPEYLRGYIQLPVRPEKVQSRADLEHDVAHELFHAVQNVELNGARMGHRYWFIEATAEYAAGYLVYPGSGAISALETSWPYKMLCTPEDTHAYGSAHFLHYLLERSGKNLMGLWKAIVREGPQVKMLETGSVAVTVLEGAKSQQETRDRIARFLVLDPIDRFLTGNTPASGTGNSLIDHQRNFIAEALFGAGIAKRAQLAADDVRLETRIDEHQLVQQFYPYYKYLENGARVEAVTIAANYSAAVWRIDAGAGFSRQPRMLLLEYPEKIPEGVEIALYAVKEATRLARVEPVALITHNRPAQTLLLPAEHDLFAIAVNSLPTEVKLPFAVTYLRPDASRRVEVAGSEATIELPSWMNPQAADSGAVWQARAGDVTAVESLRVFKRDPGDELTALRSWFEKDASDRFAGFTASGASQEVTVAGAPAIMREYTGKVEWKYAVHTRLYHEEKFARIKPGKTVTVPVRITALFVKKADEALVVEAVSTMAESPWVQGTLRSLQAGIVEGGLVLKEDFNSGTLDSKWFEHIAATGKGIGFVPGPGHRVVVESGYVRMMQEYAPNSPGGGGIITKPFPVYEGNELVIRSRHRVHRREADEGLTPHTLATFGIATEDKKGVLGGAWYVHHDESHGFFVHGVRQGPSLPPIWDAWFTQELRWNPATGKTTISVNGSKPIEATRGKATGAIRVYAHSYGWYGGHYHDLDDLEIRWVLAAQ